MASAAARSPVWLARVSATLNDISGGRFVLGLGAGLPEDAEAESGRRATPEELGSRLRDVVPAVRALWGGATSFEGHTVRFSGVTPAPHAHGRSAPTLVVAAHGPRGIDLAARHADGWTTYGATGADRRTFWATVAGQAAQLDEACVRHGRDPGDISRSVLVGYAAYRPLETVDSFVEDVERAEATGVDEVIFYWPTNGPGSAFSGDPEVVGAAVAAVLALG